MFSLGYQYLHPLTLNCDCSFFKFIAINNINNYSFSIKTNSYTRVFVIFRNFVFSINDVKFYDEIMFKLTCVQEFFEIGYFRSRYQRFYTLFKSGYFKIIKATFSFHFVEFFLKIKFDLIDFLGHTARLTYNVRTSFPIVVLAFEFFFVNCEHACFVLMKICLLEFLRT